MLQWGVKSRLAYWLRPSQQPLLWELETANLLIPCSTESPHTASNQLPLHGSCMSLEERAYWSHPLDPRRHEWWGDPWTWFSFFPFQWVLCSNGCSPVRTPMRPIKWGRQDKKEARQLLLFTRERDRNALTNNPMVCRHTQHVTLRHSSSPDSRCPRSTSRAARGIPPPVITLSFALFSFGSIKLHYMPACCCFPCSEGLQSNMIAHADSGWERQIRSPASSIFVWREEENFATTAKYSSFGAFWVTVHRCFLSFGLVVLLRYNAFFPFAKDAHLSGRTETRVTLSRPDTMLLEDLLTWKRCLIESKPTNKKRCKV